MAEEDSSYQVRLEADTTKFAPAVTDSVQDLNKVRKATEEINKVEAKGTDEQKKQWEIARKKRAELEKTMTMAQKLNEMERRRVELLAKENVALEKGNHARARKLALAAATADVEMSLAAATISSLASTGAYASDSARIASIYRMRGGVAGKPGKFGSALENKMFGAGALLTMGFGAITGTFQRARETRDAEGGLSSGRGARIDQFFTMSEQAANGMKLLADSLQIATGTLKKVIDETVGIFAKYGAFAYITRPLMRLADQQDKMAIGGVSPAGGMLSTLEYLAKMRMGTNMQLARAAYSPDFSTGGTGGIYSTVGGQFWAQQGAQVNQYLLKELLAEMQRNTAATTATTAAINTNAPF